GLERMQVETDFACYVGESGEIFAAPEPTASADLQRVFELFFRWRDEARAGAERRCAQPVMAGVERAITRIGKAERIGDLHCVTRPGALRPHSARGLDTLYLKRLRIKKRHAWKASGATGSVDLPRNPGKVVAGLRLMASKGRAFSDCLLQVIAGEGLDLRNIIKRADVAGLEAGCAPTLVVERDSPRFRDALHETAVLQGAHH